MFTPDYFANATQMKFIRHAASGQTDRVLNRLSDGYVRRAAEQNARGAEIARLAGARQRAGSAADQLNRQAEIESLVSALIVHSYP